ncbi:MAG: 16S rRNA (guanine(527)-N(7))-methyltransferase RsmG [Proteobacteria bacterium]|nr:16S rRNA (guanine(527)-N(7))-methyltransferase RsmG [Pseudomonadota bacterium]
MDGAALRSALGGVLAALELELAPDQIALLLGYLDLLARWNRTYNLTAVREPEQMLTQHIADCLAVIKPLRRALGGHEAGRVLDVGSGGGLPGAIVAIVEPSTSVTCVDAVGKKAAFVQQVAAELSLRNLVALHARVEQLPAAAFDVVTSRAFSSLADFTSLTRGQLDPSGVWMAMKGRRPDDEIAQLSSNVEVFHVERLQVPGLAAERCLVWMRPAAKA